MFSFFVLISTFAFGLAIAAVLNWLFKHLSKRRTVGLPALLLENSRSPLWVLIPSLLVLVTVKHTLISPQLQDTIRHSFNIAMIGGLGWLLIEELFAVRDFILGKFDIRTSDNLKARAVHTQVRILTRILTVIIMLFAFSSILMTFEKVRQVGIGLLASAGVAGIVIGFAAQRSIATVLAGMQIAITQPIRLDDVVIIEGEWGRIEEITLTYVVVNIWDSRRLVVPVTYFIEQPFQNWTRTSADILGTVYLYSDYTVDVDAVRNELYRLLQSARKWDGRVWGLQVTNSSDKTIEMRALMSASDASIAFDLRCEIREKLLHFLQENFPHSLPKIRAELTSHSKTKEV